MVKGRATPPPSCSDRPSPPIAHLFLASAHLKHSRPSSPLPTLLKRPPPPRVRPCMDPFFSSSPPHTSIHDAEAQPSQTSMYYYPSTDSNATSPPPRRRPSRGARMPSPPSDSSDESSDQCQDQGFTCGRQRLQQHRVQMSGKVIIPETWGSEQQLQEWVSYGIVEDALRPAGLMTARTELVSECQHRGRKQTLMSGAAAISTDVEVS